MRALQVSFLIAFACLLSACSTARTTYPVGTTAGLEADSALIGTWKDDVAYSDFGIDVHVVAGGQNKLIAIRSDLPRTPDAKTDVTLYELTTAKLGDNHFFNAVEIDPAAKGDAKPANFWPLFYTWRPGYSLKLYALDRDNAMKAIEAGRIRGHIEKHQEKDSQGKPYDVIDSVEITAEPAELDAFMAKPEALELFDIYMKLRKIE